MSGCARLQNQPRMDPYITQCQLTAGHMQDQGRIARKDPVEEEWMP